MSMAAKAAWTGRITGGFMTAGHLGVQTAQVGGVGNMNQVLEYQSELSKLPEEERERIIKQNEERYNKERAVEILTRDNLNMGDIAGALNFLGVSDPQQAAKDIERFKETGETSDLMKDKNVSSVVEVLATEGYFKKNTDKNTVNEQSQSFDNEAFENESGIELHKDFEDFPYNQKKVLKDYINYKNPKIKEFVNKVLLGKAGAKDKIYLNNVSERAAKDIKNVTGNTVDGFKIALESRIVEHINKRHGAKGLSDHSMKNINDFERIQYVLENYDNIEYAGKSKAYTTIKENGKPGLADTVKYSKKINGTFYVIEAVPITKSKTLNIVSAYISKNEAVQVSDAKNPGETSETPTAQASDSSIAQQAENVKSNVNVRERI